MAATGDHQGRFAAALSRRAGTAGVWQEQYEIVGDEPLKLILHSTGGTMASATIFTGMPE